MTNLDRSEINRALAKAIAYKNCGKESEARAWGCKLLGLLEMADVIRPGALADIATDLLVEG